MAAGVPRASCTKCPRGTYGTVQRATDLISGCMNCTIGRYSDNEGVAVATTNNLFCKACPIGRWSGTIGVTKESGCIYCIPGRYSTEGAAKQMVNVLDVMLVDIQKQRVLQ